MTSTKTLVVSDTGALISLEILPDGFKLIQKLYDRILIPLKVAEEIGRHYGGLIYYLRQYNIEHFIELEESEINSQIPGIQTLHSGEAQAISLAFRLGLPILIEERRGRAVAKAAGLKYSGVAGDILRLFVKKIISRKKALDLLKALLQNQRINNKIYQLLAEDISNT